jgi:hypothetical protein
MVQSYIGNYNGKSRRMYKLVPPSRANTQYLLNEAKIQINKFLMDASALSKVNNEVEQDDIDHIHELQQKMLHTAESDTDPGVVVFTIPAIINWMMAIAESVDPDEIPVYFLTSTRSLYYIYVLGVIDMCCTMDGGSTVIDQDYNAEHQLYLIERVIENYPKLSAWLEVSLEDWKRGEIMSYRMRTQTSGFEAMAWYLTSYHWRCKLHSLEIYHKEGHAAT